MAGGEVFTVTGKGQSFQVQVSALGGAGAAVAAVAAMSAGTGAAPAASAAAPAAKAGMGSPLAGNIWKVEVEPGQAVEEGDLLFVLEAMKMEYEVIAETSGVVAEVMVKKGDAVIVGQPLLNCAGAAGAVAAAAPAAAAAAPATTEGGVAAPLAGNVWKIEVSVGQKVQEGDLLMILEAMKMENEIIAERDGTVGQLLVQEGAKVGIGQILLTLI
jgi:oxaloacetate decarboxylase alpha subunit